MTRKKMASLGVTIENYYPSRPGSTHETTAWFWLRFCADHWDEDTVRATVEVHHMVVGSRKRECPISYDATTLLPVPANESPTGCAVCGYTEHEFMYIGNGLRYNVKATTEMKNAYKEYRARLKPLLWKGSISERDFLAGWTIARSI